MQLLFIPRYAVEVLSCVGSGLTYNYVS